LEYLYIKIFHNIPYANIIFLDQYLDTDLSSQSLRTSLPRWFEIQDRCLASRVQAIVRTGGRAPHLVPNRELCFFRMGADRRSGFLKSAPAGTRTWQSGSSHAAHVRRPTDDSPHPVVTQTSRSTISVGSVATVIGHQHHCATSKSRAARLVPRRAGMRHLMRVDCMSATRCPHPKGLSSRRKLS
jgi:hypothetical protein